MILLNCNACARVSKQHQGCNLASDSQRSVVLDPVSGQAYASRVAHITGNKTGAGIFLRNDRSDFLAGEAIFGRNVAVLPGLPAQAEGSGDRPAALTGSIRTDTRARVRSRVDGQERAHELDLAHGAVGAALGSHLPRRPGRASEISAHSDRLVIPFSGSSNKRRERVASRRPEVERPGSTPGIRGGKSSSIASAGRG